MTCGRNLHGMINTGVSTKKNGKLDLCHLKDSVYIYSPQAEQEAPLLMRAHIMTMSLEGHRWSSLDWGGGRWLGRMKCVSHEKAAGSSPGK